MSEDLKSKIEKYGEAMFSDAHCRFLDITDGTEKVKARKLLTEIHQEIDELMEYKRKYKEIEITMPNCFYSKEEAEKVVEKQRKAIEIVKKHHCGNVVMRDGFITWLGSCNCKYEQQ